MPTSQPTPAQQAQAQAAQNLQARQMLLRSGTPMRKNLGIFGPFAAGQLASVQLNNVGILTSIDAVVTAEVTITALGVISQHGPFNFVRNVNMTDYTNQSRINISHTALEVILSARHRRVQNQAYLTDMVDTVATAGGGASLVQIPTAIVAPVASNLRIPVHIPICYDPASDLRGAIMAQTIRGQQFISLQLPTNAQLFSANDDAVYNAGAGTVANIYIQVFQNYIQPAMLGAATQLPLVDLATVYELNGQGVSTNNISVGQTKFIDYPNVRQVLSAILQYNNGGGAGAGYAYGTDITSLSVEANSNTKLREYVGQDLLDRMRTIFGGDSLAGLYYLDSRRNPINTQLYGQVQILLTPSVVNVVNAAYSTVSFESFYLKGTALPGISTG